LLSLSGERSVTDEELLELIEDAYQDGLRIFGRRCPVCQREFVPKNPNAIYDRNACRVTAWKRRQRSG
jgi:hypothetical protein